eukprot:7969802-Pyramimonas_sp.AAC.1
MSGHDRCVSSRPQGEGQLILGLVRCCIMLSLAEVRDRATEAVELQGYTGGTRCLCSMTWSFGAK